MLQQTVARYVRRLLITITLGTDMVRVLLISRFLALARAWSLNLQAKHRQHQNDCLKLAEEACSIVQWIEVESKCFQWNEAS